MNSPPHTSTASDKATWTTTSVGRNEKRRPFVRSPAARSPFRIGTTSGFDECQAGARPKINPVASEITAVKTSARESSVKKLSTMLYWRTGTKPSIRSVTQYASRDRKSTRLNSSHGYISYAVFCLKKKKK